MCYEKRNSLQERSKGFKKNITCITGNSERTSDHRRKWCGRAERMKQNFIPNGLLNRGRREQKSLGDLEKVELAKTDFSGD